MLALFGVSFLTPLNALFVLAAAVPLTALALTERRADQIRRILRLQSPGRRALVPVAAALVLLPALVAVAAAQPVVVREQFVSERADAQAFVLFDTSLSMRAAEGPGRPTRLVRAKKLALRLQRSLADVPMGIASMTDRSLPIIMPTTDPMLFRRAVEQSVAINEPPPSQQYSSRATTFAALVPLVESHFFSQGVQRRLLIVLTDGEDLPASQAHAASPRHAGLHPCVGAGREDLLERPCGPEVRRRSVERQGARRSRRDHGINARLRREEHVGSNARGS
jgi:hypothetical protein